MLCYYQFSKGPGNDEEATRDGESIPVNMFNLKKGEKLIQVNNSCLELNFTKKDLLTCALIFPTY